MSLAAIQVPRMDTGHICFFPAEGGKGPLKPIAMGLLLGSAPRNRTCNVTAVTTEKDPEKCNSPTPRACQPRVTLQATCARNGVVSHQTIEEHRNRQDACSNVSQLISFYGRIVPDGHGQDSQWSWSPDWSLHPTATPSNGALSGKGQLAVPRAMSPALCPTALQWGRLLSLSCQSGAIKLETNQFSPFPLL